jgi:hypothetical protein
MRGCVRQTRGGSRDVLRVADFIAFYNGAPRAKFCLGVGGPNTANGRANFRHVSRRRHCRERIVSSNYKLLYESMEQSKVVMVYVHKYLSQNPSVPLCDPTGSETLNRRAINPLTSIFGKPSINHVSLGSRGLLFCFTLRTNGPSAINMALISGYSLSKPWF